uniref:Uncharacterized protein n=1 Tax=Timema bartmani TaxID=61472 RepID=A0A7R9EMQ9_9NEOP|nr:unnamed protein product [Timema bartmani]
MDAWLLCISALLLVGSALNLPTEGSLKEDSLLTLAAGEGQNATDEEEEKTLSQQIVEGKYGLIQKELYSEKPRRPGVLSYADNLEVPRDTADNYGGLDSGEIWLAENHVLVLRGGHFPDHNSSEGTRTRPVWPPLDGYQAPARQVKIPPNPKALQRTSGLVSSTRHYKEPQALYPPPGTTKNLRPCIFHQALQRTSGLVSFTRHYKEPQALYLSPGITKNLRPCIFHQALQRTSGLVSFTRHYKEPQALYLPPGITKNLRPCIFHQALQRTSGLVSFTRHYKEPQALYLSPGITKNLRPCIFHQALQRTSGLVSFTRHYKEPQALYLSPGITKNLRPCIFHQALQRTSGLVSFTRHYKEPQALYLSPGITKNLRPCIFHQALQRTSGLVSFTRHYKEPQALYLSPGITKNLRPCIFHQALQRTSGLVSFTRHYKEPQALYLPPGTTKNLRPCLFTSRKYKNSAAGVKQVPPPFPVQLREGGPTQFIGPNGTLFPVPGNGSYFGPFPPGDPFLPPPGFNRSTPFSPSGNVSTGNGPFFPLPPRPFPGFPFPLPTPPGVFPPINGTLPMLPPGGMFLPPPDNLTDLYDEDDPSIYYPPPYDFFYQRDNSTPVPPGPLVPGIVLPPPPDFFAPLVNSTPTPLTTVRYKPQPITTTPPAHVIKEVTTATVDLSTTTPNSLKLEVIPVKQQLPELRPFDVPSDYDELNAILYPSSAPVVSYNLDPVTDIVVRPRPSYSYKPPQKPTYILEYESYKGRQPDYYYYDEVTQRSKATPAPPKASYYYDEVTQRSKATPSPPKGLYYYDEVTQRSKATPSPPKASYYYDEVTQRSKATPAPPKASYYYDEVTQRSKVTPAPPKASYYYYEEPHISVAHVSHIPSLSPRPLLDLSRLTQAERFLLQQISGLVHKTTSAPRYNYYSPKAQDYYNSGPVVYYNSGSPREQEYYSSPRYYTSPKPHNYYSGIPRSQNYYANIPSPQNYYSTPSAQNYYSTTPSPQNYYNAPRAQNYYSTTPSPPDYYSTPEAQNHYSTTPRPSYSSAPRPQRYYSSTTTPQPVYYSPSQTVSYYQPHTTPHPQQEAAVTNPTILRHKSPPAPTSNPLNSAYFTKQDESLLDDITKKYFTIFGQKLPESPGATTPLPLSSDRGHEPRLRQKQQQQPKSLETDLLVNYRQPLPAFNPKSELVDVYSQTKDGSGALVSYNLPGDSGHVYFITPQLVGGPGYSHKVPERQLVYPSKREDS